MNGRFWYLRTVIVADDPLFGRLLRILLRSSGFGEVDIVNDLASLHWRQARLWHDLVIADGELLATDGLDLLSLVTTACPPLAAPLLVIVSGNTSRRFRERCMEHGADAVIHKPITPETLTEGLVGLLTSQRAWRCKVVPHPRSFADWPLCGAGGRGFPAPRAPAG